MRGMAAEAMLSGAGCLPSAEAGSSALSSSLSAKGLGLEVSDAERLGEDCAEPCPEVEMALRAALAAAMTELVWSPLRDAGSLAAADRHMLRR
jgi:hypothetical protein